LALVLSATETGQYGSEDRRLKEASFVHQNAFGLFRSGIKDQGAGEMTTRIPALVPGVTLSSQLSLSPWL